MFGRPQPAGRQSECPNACPRHGRDSCIRSRLKSKIADRRGTASFARDDVCAPGYDKEVVEKPPPVRRNCGNRLSLLCPLQEAARPPLDRPALSLRRGGRLARTSDSASEPVVSFFSGNGSETCQNFDAAARWIHPKSNGTRILEPAKCRFHDNVGRGSPVPRGTSRWLFRETEGVLEK